MQAKDFYEIGCRAYNGDDKSRQEFFSTLSPVAIRFARVYGVLPSYILAKLVIESGYMTDLWNATAERLTGKVFQRKAQDHNNVFGMNAWEDNRKYLNYLPHPRWKEYGTTFNDWGPHGWGDTFHVKWEPWKEYRTLEDSVEDWCANIRYQSAAHGHQWNPGSLKAQLLATESYTPEGSSAGVREGLHYEWQESIMKITETYNLYQYDEKVWGRTMEKVPMTKENLDKHVKSAYQFAHAHCKYGPSDRHFPPGEDGQIDCVGLVFRALYTMGYLDKACNIDQIEEACKKAGMKKSTDAADAWRHHAVVCMQEKHNAGTPHVNHVYYSLGGQSAHQIKKYDLGNDDRIRTTQPFTKCEVNEWPDKYNFLCCYYVPDRFRPDTPHFDDEHMKAGIVKTKTGLYAGPGTAWSKTKTMAAGERVLFGVKVTNDKGTSWRHTLTLDGKEGYIYHTAVTVDQKKESYKASIANASDGFAALRIGAGMDCFKIAELAIGTTVTVDGAAMAADGSKWLHVVSDGKRGFVYSGLVERMMK